MKNLLKPTKYYQNIFLIDYSTLKKQGIKAILLDIDNTIAKVDEKYLSSQTISFLTKLSQKFNIIIISNALPRRVKRITQNLSLKSYYLSCKPLSQVYNKIKKIYSASELVAIGDQIYTDILGANKAHIMSVLVDPLSNKESFLTKINRYRENKSHIIERGKYYD